MKQPDTEVKWLDAYQRLCEVAEHGKDSQSVPFELLRVYDELTTSEVQVVHRVIGKWLTSNNSAQRYDATFLITERRIVDLMPQVLAAITECEHWEGAEARDYVDQLRALMRELSRPEPQGS